jgi:catalase
MSKKSLAQEYPPAGEEAYINDLAERLKAKIIKDNPSGIMRRDAHPKMHGVVKAEFIVEPNLPEQMQVGLFKEPKTYQAWIRFSNQDGSINPDINPDIRGMAIKLMGVPGKKLQEFEEDEQTQDLILISTNVFVTKNVEEFDDLIKALAGGILSKAQFFLTHWRVVWNLLKSMKKFANPLQIRYFSTTPYRFENHAVKYATTPHVTVADEIPVNPDDNFMRAAMKRQLQDGDATFDFSVQFQTDAQTMPIEDPGKEWPEAESPFIKIATIKILQQSFDNEKQNEFGENLSYSPWHSLPEHRPLGGINRARRVIYPFISKFRHQKNNVPVKEPSSWEI